MAKAKATGMPAKTSIRKTLMPMANQISGSNLAPPLHPGKQLNHLGIKYQANSNSPYGNE